MDLETSTRYGFYGRLSSQFPSQIIVDVTEICNLACIHCPHPDFKKSHHYSGRTLDPELNKKLVDEVRDFGREYCQYIRYTSNGEPLVHKHIFDMLKYAKEHSGVMVALTTNGKIMREAQVQKLLDTNLDFVDISIDAHTPETYSTIRVGGNLDVTRNNVLRLIEMRNQQNRSTKIVTSYVEQPQNTHETEDFKRFWEDAGADYVVIRRLHSAAGGRPEIAEVMHSVEFAGTRRPCVYPWERIVLGPSGALSFCPADWSHGSAIGDFRHHSIRETWQGEAYKKLREAHLNDDYSCHKFCGQCPDWKVITWPGQGRNYADMVEEFKREGVEITGG